jgi:tetratricopeptide (TPR) repeat protein
MGRLRRAAKHAAVPLLALLLFGASAAAPTAEQAARDARTALDYSRLDEAQRIIDDALQRFGTRGDETVWSLRVMSAEVLQKRGDHPGAKAAALQDRLPASLNTSETAVRRLLVLGNAAIHLGPEGEAKSHLNKALAIAKAHQPQMLSRIFVALAIAAPNLSHAEPLIAKAIAAARTHKQPDVEIQALGARQYQMMRAGHLSDAVDEGEKALALAKSSRDEWRICQLSGNLGWAYISLGDDAAAEELFVLADATAARNEFDRVPWLIQLGNMRVQKRDWIGAERYYRDALAPARSTTHKQLAFVLANLASMALETGRLDEARRYNAEALELKRAAKDTESELLSLILDARIAAARGDGSNAEAILNRVITNAASASTRWEAQGRRAEIFVQSKRYADAERDFRSVLQTAREARSAIDKPELRLAFYGITFEIFSAYIDFLIAQGRIVAALGATEMIRIDAFDDAMETQTAAAAIDERAVAKQLNATILSYWLGARNSYVWIVTANAIRAARREPKGRIAAAVDGYRRELTTARGPGPRGQQLYALLGVRSVARGSRVVIIPDDALHALNFETLVVPSAQPHYWIDDVTISEASSIRVLAQRNQQRAAASKMLLVGNPPQADPAFRPLPRANEEMQSIAGIFPPSQTKVLGGAAATPAAYRAASPGSFDYLHFVAHGVATRRRPLESAVILGRDATNNYKLLARQVLDQPLRARLVTISSCHGAGTRAYTGEGLVGLAWAFLRAGAGNVIAALWEVNDSATPQLMNRLYTQTAAGGDPAAALRDAKLSLLRSNSVYRYPRYWAPFVLYRR